MNMKAQRVFEDAIDLPLAERGAFLDQACAGDAALRREVESLLASFQRAEGFLSEPSISMSRLPGMAADATHLHAPGDVEDMLTVFERPGDLVGRYRLIEEIGSGGFGVVFKAEQTEPVKRHVALKIIKVGMDTRQRMARFDAERQALAMMDHPNIAKVLDAGATPTGRLYFVMELVEGTTITCYSDDHKLSIEQRLDLFRQVCGAVQHAHQKGIIHRDIKPSNVLVSIVDGKPAPKVIDFGIAKAVNVTLTERTLFTESHQVLGTPAYMSPEQADNADGDIDTRTDVYSLGVLLYELLTGVTPFDFAHMRTIALGEMLRMIRQDEPIKPSLKLSKDTSGTIAADRRSDTRRLESTLRGDLDWIVMKCLEKDRTRRYATAQSIAEDVQRYLGNEPVMAGPPSVGYRAAKFYKRNRAAVLAVSAFGLLIVTGLIVIAVMYAQVLQQRRNTDTTIVAVQNATTNLGLALFGSLNSKQGELGKDAVLERLRKLEADADGIDWSRLPQPEYDIRKTLAIGYECLGESERARTQLDQLATLGARLTPPRMVEEVRREMAETLLEQTRLRSVAGDSHAARRLAEQGVALLEANHDQGTLLHTRLQITYATVLSDLGARHDAIQRLEDVEKELEPPASTEEEIALGETRFNLAVNWRTLGRPTDAMRIAEQALAINAKVRSPDHVDVVRCLGLIGLLHRDLSEDTKAGEYFAKADRAAASWPTQSPDRRHLVELYGQWVYWLMPNQPPELESKLEQSLQLALPFAPEGNAEIAQAMMQLGVCRYISRDFAAAEQWTSRAYEMCRTHNEWMPEVTRLVRSNLARMRLQKGDFQRAIVLLREVVEIDERGTNAANLRKSRSNFTQTQELWKHFRIVDALGLYRAFFVRLG